MTLYLARHPLGLRIYTQLGLREREVLGDITELLLPGESFGGLSYEELETFAATIGQVDSDQLRTEQ